MQTVTEMVPRLGVALTCAALGLPRATYYRGQQPRPEPKPRPASVRALPPEERRQVLAVLHEPRFVDLAPAEVYATMLHEDRYLCSERTFYRVLAENAEVRERRSQLRHPHYAAPELLATHPTEPWSWDITRLLGPTKWTYFYRYVVLDVFSRHVVGWMLAHRELARLAKKLIAESCERQCVVPGQPAVHADRGSAMTSKPVALLMADLGVTKSHSRPHVSNDTPLAVAREEQVARAVSARKLDVLARVEAAQPQLQHACRAHGVGDRAAVALHCRRLAANLLIRANAVGAMCSGESAELGGP
jgi:putative transposase